jgi:DNA-binding transcriptional MerR regulator
MTESFHIGELATRTGRSTHAIRWYESQGLIPGVRRDRGGRRTYVELHVGWLELIDHLRRTGMAVAEIHDYVALVQEGSGTLGERKRLLSAHRTQVEGSIAELRCAVELIDAKVDFYDEWIRTGRQPPPLAAGSDPKVG